MPKKTSKNRGLTCVEVTLSDGTTVSMRMPANPTAAEVAAATAEVQAGYEVMKEELRAHRPARPA